MPFNQTGYDATSPNFSGTVQQFSDVRSSISVTPQFPYSQSALPPKPHMLNGQQFLRNQKIPQSGCMKGKAVIPSLVDNEPYVDNFERWNSDGINISALTEEDDLNMDRNLEEDSTVTLADDFPERNQSRNEFNDMGMSSNDHQEDVSHNSGHPNTFHSPQHPIDGQVQHQPIDQSSRARPEPGSDNSSRNCSRDLHSSEKVDVDQTPTKQDVNQPVKKQRKKRQMATEEERNDPVYCEKRRKNTTSAQRSREKAKNAQIAKDARLKELEEKNKSLEEQRRVDEQQIKSLQQQIKNLQQQIGTPQHEDDTLHYQNHSFEQRLQAVEQRIGALQQRQVDEQRIESLQQQLDYCNYYCGSSNFPQQSGYNP